MAVALLLLLALAAATTAAAPPPPPLLPPTNLLVDLTEPQVAPLLLVTAGATPAFSFSGAATEPTTHYQITVTDSAGKAAWDSGKQPGAAAGIVCGAALTPGATYQWGAQIWSGASAAPSAPATGTFTVGLLSETDWAGAEWLGGGQKQFKLSPPADSLVSPGSVMKLHVASPGGAIVELRGGAGAPRPIGDPVGISLWTETSKSVQYISYDITGAMLEAGAAAEIVVTAGGGFWTSTNHAAAVTNGASEPAVRMLLVLGTARGGDRVLMKSSTAAGAAILGRAGPVLKDDPWQGTTLDTTLGDATGWAAPTPADEEATPQGKLFPLPAPYATTRGHYAATSVSKVAGRPSVFLYTFPANIVGHASVSGAAFHGAGNLTLEYCEVWNHSAGGCIPFDIPGGSVYRPGTPPGYPSPLPICGKLANGTADHGSSLAGCDTFLVDTTQQRADAGSPLSTKFTWHGFQYVVVAPSAGVTFSGAVDALAARWTTADLSESATINFGGGEGSETLQSIMKIVKSSQISNLAAYMPTDCPTREKHGWLGDSQITAEEAMYNLYSPGIYSRFLSQIRDSQLTIGGNGGFVAGVVPGRTSTAVPVEGVKTGGLDISWSAAYPMDASWLLRYYGDLLSVKEHWPSLKLYTDGQLRVAKGQRNGTGLPDFWTWGDWCAVEPRATATPSTGPQAAAANFLLALQAMVEMGTAVGDHAAALQYKQIYESLLPVFSKRFWNPKLGTWADTAIELQTLTSLSLGVGVGSASQRASAVLALEKDIVSRGYHLTVGSAGQKWLLRTLSKEGKHDTALKLAMQTTYPSWGWWLSQGATTCWESWSGVADPSHPPHPTHNHIFLCGGVGEWMYEYLAGIVPTSAGYATVDVKPLISKTLGPSTLDAAVRTVRGTIRSNWTRHQVQLPAAQPLASGTRVVTLHVQIPSGSEGAVRVPLLGLSGSEARVRLQSGGAQPMTLWNAGMTAGLVAGLGGCRIVRAPDGDEVLELSTGPGGFTFEVTAA